VSTNRNAGSSDFLRVSSQIARYLNGHTAAVGIIMTLLEIPGWHS
jgi:hypothetical protein